MARQPVCDVVEAHLAANWSRSAILGENSQGAVPADNSPYVIVQYPFVTARQISTGDPGNNLWRDEGAFRFVLHVPLGSGTATGRGWAEEIAVLFRGKDLGVIQTGAPTAPVTDDRNPTSAYYVLSFSCPYRHDYYG